jgi:hypothetical protein
MGGFDRMLRAPVSPPTMANVPKGVSALRRRVSDEFPPMSTITS